MGCNGMGIGKKWMVEWYLNYINCYSSISFTRNAVCYMETNKNRTHINLSKSKIKNVETNKQTEKNDWHDVFDGSDKMEWFCFDYMFWEGEREGEGGMEREVERKRERFTVWLHFKWHDVFDWLDKDWMVFCGLKNVWDF